MHFKTIHDVNDGFDGKTAACREYTKLREDPGSKIKACIEWYTKIDPVLQDKILMEHLAISVHTVRCTCAFADGDFVCCKYFAP